MLIGFSRTSFPSLMSSATSSTICTTSKVEVGAEVGRVVFGEMDVVVRLDRDDVLHSRCTPIVYIVFGESAGLPHVIHFRGGAGGRAFAGIVWLLFSVVMSPPSLERCRCTKSG